MENIYKDKGAKAHSLIQSIEKSQRNKNLFIAALIILVLITGGFAWMGVNTVQTEEQQTEEKAAVVNELEAQIEELEAKNREKAGRISELQDSIENLKAERQRGETKDKPPGEVTHVVREGQTLSHISVEHFGHTDKINEIARQNELKNPDLILTGQELVIKK